MKKNGTMEMVVTGMMMVALMGSAFLQQNWYQHLIDGWMGR